MKIFVFGAGASQGSIDDPRLFEAHKLPPLVDQLFDSVYVEKYCKDIGMDPATINDYRNKIPKNISLEKWLSDWWNDIPNYPDVIAQNSEKTRFARLTIYLWVVLQGVLATYNGSNAYRLLLNKLREERVTAGYINFNYDTLFDKALQEVNGVHLIGSLDNYTDARYVKPHGSVNWFLNMRGGNVDRRIENVNEIQVKLNAIASRMFLEPHFSMDHIYVADPEDSSLNELNYIQSAKFHSQYAYPLLFMPLTGKIFSLIDGFYDRIITDGKKILSQASDIYLIGYRANDEIIKELFTSIESEAKLHIVSRKNEENNTNAQTIMNEVLEWAKVKSKGFLVEGEKYNGGFRSFVSHYLENKIKI